jgi:hypothetical protein
MLMNASMIKERRAKIQPKLRSYVPEQVWSPIDDLLL